MRVKVCKKSVQIITECETNKALKKLATGKPARTVKVPMEHLWLEGDVCCEKLAKMYNVFLNSRQYEKKNETLWYAGRKVM